ncbi:hypothetical protein BC827DRAFT_164265 [Russula dissimulans]|nr:hypothetical protein BC827DRAFT_164265 [Russula dissimulans]
MNKSNVADRLSHIDDDGIEWTNATSKNGVLFEIGIKKTDLEVTVKDHRGGSTQAANPFFHVNWPVGDDTWKSTSGELNRDWISRYKLPDNPPSIYYRLHITSVTRRTATYVFTDEADDSYTLKVHSVGDHTVRYFSEKPTIVRVDILT